MNRSRPWEVWWLDFAPTEGRAQAGQRRALAVSSRSHLDLTAGALVSVLPLTTRERPGWLHRVAIEVPGRRTGRLITEQGAHGVGQPTGRAGAGVPAGQQRINDPSHQASRAGSTRWWAWDHGRAAGRSAARADGHP
ncbi:type II toxin-antitoxin system PemK/MazF family toxin [Micromonospora viridifaciens]|uniref:type II toxin-antitoxin system PemK/MazF family toxin n=1 Tax=Micromonospora viridifaciens TaxID=1881 RepID=UPI0012FDA2B9